MLQGHQNSKEKLKIYKKLYKLKYKLYAATRAEYNINRVLFDKLLKQNIKSQT